MPPHELPEPDELREQVLALVGLIVAARDLLPPELSRQVTELARQILLLTRALIDRGLERLEAAEAAGREPVIEDIPIS
jgi:hypothetical protein